MGQFSMPRGEWKRRKQDVSLTPEPSTAPKVEEEVPTDIFEAIEQANLHGVKILLKNDAALVKNKDGECAVHRIRDVGEWATLNAVICRHGGLK